jgi:hypothetical protein
MGMVNEMNTKKGRQNCLAEGMSGASCGSRTVHHCVLAAAEGMKNYIHPKQGSAKDCSVIAALSSIAAVAPGRISGTYPNYNFLSGTVTLSSKRLAVDASGTLVYASSTGGSWPMLWEKAYAKLISTATCPKPASCPERQNCTGEPDIAAAFDRGWAGLTAMKEIGRYRTEVSGSFSMDASGNMLLPAIAKTNNTLGENDFWKRDHDYSVIKFDTVNKKYKIRNPCGGVEQWVAETEFKPGSPHFTLWGHVKDPV